MRRHKPLVGAAYRIRRGASRIQADEVEKRGRKEVKKRRERGSEEIEKKGKEKRWRKKERKRYRISYRIG